MERPLTSYEKELAAIMAGRYKRMPTAQLVLELCRIGVVDYSLCKILSVRIFVENAVKNGEKKMAAMWAAADHFSATYEFVRKCMYYHKDINV